MSQKKNNQTLDVNDSIAQSEAFILKNKKMLITAIICIAAAIGGWFAYSYYEGERSEKASTALALGQEYFMAEDYATALNGDGKDFPGYLAIAEEYKFTDAANLAHLYAGICYAKSDTMAAAIKHLEAFSPKGDQTISPAALGTLANCYATNNEIDKAVDTFVKAAKLADNASLSPVFLLNAGMLLESQGKTENANKIYKQIKSDYPTSIIAQPGFQMGKVFAPEIDKYIERTSK